MSLPVFDHQYCTDLLLELLEIPSPSGFTGPALDRLSRELEGMGLTPKRTPKGALLWTLAGSAPGERAVASHIDTLGAMVKEVKENGRLKLSSLGGYDWATIEGAECRVHTFGGGVVTGTVVNVKQSSHVFGSRLAELRRTQEVMEVRLDARVRGRDDVLSLGVMVGDVVSFDSGARLTPEGFIKGRHLDNKAAVAVCLAVTHAFLDARQLPGSDVHFFVSNYEEVGHGAAAGIPEKVAELLCIDMAAVGEGQTSDEFSVSLCVKDSSGPYDERMNRRLRELAAAVGIALKVDIYPHYSSDASAAWRAGGGFRAALIGPGVDGSHAYERTHREALEATGKLLMAYLGLPLT